MSEWDQYGAEWQPPASQQPVPPPATPEWIASAGTAVTYPVAAAAPKPRPPRRPIRLLLSSAAALTVVAVILPIVGSTTPASASVLVAAARSTLAERTAAISVSGNFSAAGQTIPITGSGSIDFGQQEMSLNLQIPTPLQTVSMQEVVTGGTVYVSTPGISTLEPGKSWISEDVGTAASSSGAGSPLSNLDPASQLQMLEQQGYGVTSLGQSQVDGTTVNGYEVNISSSQIDAALHGLSSAASGAGVSGQGITFDVYVDGSNDIVRFGVNISLTAGSTTVTGTLNIDFSQYGSPVSVTAPPAYQVVSLQQFEQDAGASATP